MTIPAGQLKPGEHFLTSVKVDYTAVTSIQQAGAADESCKRAAVVVHQGDRHSVLVKPLQASGSGFVAVGSADACLLKIEPAKAGNFLTFTDEDRRPALLRSISAPALLVAGVDKYRRHQERIAYVKGKPSYKKWKAWWDANGGRGDGDPQTPKHDQSKKTFTEEYTQWLRLCKQEPPESA